MGKNEKGQVLLIVVLVMIVALTVGLSLAARSIVDLRTSEEEISSKKALSAAEAGIEQAIESNVSIANSSFDPNTSFKTDVVEVKGTSFLLNGGNPILQDEGVDLWLSDYSDDQSQIYQNPWSGNLTIYWGETSIDCQSSALEIQVVFGTKLAPVLTRYAFDSCQNRSLVNHFTLASLLSPSEKISGKDFFYKTTISVSSGLLARIVPLYSNSIVAVSGNFAFPSQGFVIDSIGASGTTQRKITVFKGYRQLNNQNFSFGLFAP